MRYIVSDNESGIKLVTFLKNKLGDKVSARQIKSLIESNRCTINNRIERFASYVVGKGNIITLDWEDGVSPQHNASFQFEKNRILYEDEYLMIYNKPAGISSDQQGLEKLVKTNHPNWHLVHRLDKETSGALIFSKSEKIFNEMVELFHKMLINKEYLAIVDGVVKNNLGKIENKLGKLKEYQGQTIWGEVKEPKGQTAITEWEKIKHSEQVSLILCKPKTGRTHQLRVHLAGMKHPILGDYQYSKSFKCSYKPVRIMLHAWKLNFLHPVTQQRLFVMAPLPDDFEQTLESLRLK